MGDYWLISAPGEKTCQQTWEKINKVLPSGHLSDNYKFHIPDLKVGTLDVLVGLSDDLSKADTFIENVVKKIAQYMMDIYEGDKNKVSEILLINGTDVNTYLSRFQWDTAKFPIKLSLISLTETINKKVSQIDSEFKIRSTHYNNLKKDLTNLERKNTGSLLTRNLNEIIKKEEFVLGSEYLVTLLVVVPKHMYKDWTENYENLSDMIVPQSSKLVFEDDENGLYTVTLFRKVVDDFKHHAREKHFTVRDYNYDDDQIALGKNEATKLASDAKKAYNPLLRWLQVNFTESFTSWIHLKAIRIFTESVLRYGLPVNFLAVLIKVPKKHQKKMREVLFHLFKHLDSTLTTTGKAHKINENEELPGLNYGQNDYYPYVWFEIPLTYLEVAKTK